MEIIDLQLFKNIMAEARNNTDLLDSFSPNQFKSKQKLVDMIHNYVDIYSDTEIVIFGGWYGSILIPMFKDVKKITLIDLDEEVINIARNRLFNHYKNVEFRIQDVFEFNKFFSKIIERPSSTISTSKNSLPPPSAMSMSESISIFAISFSL